MPGIAGDAANPIVLDQDPDALFHHPTHSPRNAAVLNAHDHLGRGGVPLWVVTSLLLFLFAFNLARGNPTQQVDKLFKMMSQGMAGGEDSFAFDKIYKVKVKF